MSEAPNDLKYSKSHEWVRVNDDGTVTVGITDHAQELLGDLVYVEVPDQGIDLEPEQACAVVESVKAASDVYAPIAGTVVTVNESLADTPELVNKDAYGDGWIMTLQPRESAELNELMDADQYQEFIESD